MTNLTGARNGFSKTSPRRYARRIPCPKVNQKGLVERDGTPKEGYYVFQSYWADKPMIHIYGHSWPVRWGKAARKNW